MTIPDYQTVMLPLLRLAADDREHFVREAVEELAREFKPSEVERKEQLPSGGQATFDNRVCWARTYMKKAGCWSPPGAATSASPGGGRNLRLFRGSQGIRPDAPE